MIWFSVTWHCHKTYHDICNAPATLIGFVKLVTSLTAMWVAEMAKCFMANKTHENKKRCYITANGSSVKFWDPVKHALRDHTNNCDFYAFKMFKNSLKITYETYGVNARYHYTGRSRRWFPLCLLTEAYTLSVRFGPRSFKYRIIS